MNYSTTNSSGTSSVALGVGHFLLFPVPHGGGFVAFCALLKLIPTYIPGWGGSGFTLTVALVPIATEKVSRIRSNIIWNWWKSTLRARSIRVNLNQGTEI